MNSLYKELVLFALVVVLVDADCTVTRVSTPATTEVVAI
ncbi:hypothetical protein VFA_001841 [Vibrio furnissii CIP 102972]|nr:hypothetical protein VFA_001841 [Vibrio furnissii CIP 102972]